jgi:hypothetical protein
MADNFKADLKDYENIVLPYLDTVYGAAVVLCGDNPDAEDLAQTTFMNALEAFETFEPGMDCKSWLLRILRTAWKDKISQEPPAGAVVSFEAALASMPVEGLCVPRALEDRILAHMVAYAGVPEKRVLPFRLPAWSAWVGLAAILILAVSLFFRFGDPSFPARAQTALVQIHQANLDPDSQLFQDRDPEKLSSYLISKLGFVPRFPKTTPTIIIRGCGVRKFYKKMVASYILDTPAGEVSIIVISQHPSSLGLKEPLGRIGDDTGTCWIKSLGKVNLAAVRRNNFSYFALGSLSQEKLIETLMAAYPSHNLE